MQFQEEEGKKNKTKQNKITTKKTPTNQPRKLPYKMNNTKAGCSLVFCSGQGPETPAHFVLWKWRAKHALHIHIFKLSLVASTVGAWPKIFDFSQETSLQKRWGRQDLLTRHSAHWPVSSEERNCLPGRGRGDGEPQKEQYLHFWWVRSSHKLQQSWSPAVLAKTTITPSSYSCQKTKNFSYMITVILKHNNAVCVSKTDLLLPAKVKGLYHLCYNCF